jgi:hypothetical protein
MAAPKILRRLHEGPLGVLIDLYAARLLREGYRRQGAGRSLQVICDFSHWLARKHIDLCSVSEPIV